MNLTNKKNKGRNSGVTYEVNCPFSLQDKIFYFSDIKDTAFYLVKDILSKKLIGIDLTTAIADYFIRRKFPFVEKIFCDLNTSCDIKVTMNYSENLKEDDIILLNSTLFKFFTEEPMIGLTEELVDEVNINYYLMSTKQVIDDLNKRFNDMKDIDFDETDMEADDFVNSDEIGYFLEIFENNPLDKFVEENFEKKEERELFLSKNSDDQQINFLKNLHF